MVRFEKDKIIIEIHVAGDANPRDEYVMYLEDMVDVLQHAVHTSIVDGQYLKNPFGYYFSLLQAMLPMDENLNMI